MENGWSVNKPTVNYSPYDFVVDINNRLIKIQVKTRTIQIEGNHRRIIYGKKKYNPKDFEYYAVYLHEIDKWIFLPNDGTLSMTFNNLTLKKFSTFV